MKAGSKPAYSILLCLVGTACSATPEGATTSLNLAGGAGIAGMGGSLAAISGGGLPSSPAACDEVKSSRIADIGTGAKPSGAFSVIVEIDPAIPDYTVYRPDPIGAIEHPVVAWANGGCSKDGTGFSEFLMEVASHGFLVVADGTPGGTGSRANNVDGSVLTNAIDWATAENERHCSKYYHKLDATKVAVAGHSCGGLVAFDASADERISTSIPLNSGLFARDPQLYSALHAPMAIIDGGTGDIAYANGQADFAAINNIPILFANLPTGHGGTYWQDNGGEFAKVAVAWLRWWLLDDRGPTGKTMFVGPECGLCNDSDWSLMWKRQPE